MGFYNLTFATLRIANRLRLPLFKDKKGRWAHSKPDGSDWTLGEWVAAVVGELGEAANLIKKVLRGDLTLDEARPLIAEELADTVTYLDILALQMGIDLGEAIARKFNVISERVKAPVAILENRATPLHTPALIRLAYVEVGSTLVCSEDAAKNHAEHAFATRAEARQRDERVVGSTDPSASRT